MKKEDAMKDIAENSLVLNLLYNLAWPISRLAIFLKLTPNFVTTLSNILSIISIYFLMIDQILGFVSCHLLALVLDHSDGMIARVTKAYSAHGGFYDSFSDLIKVGMLFLFIGLKYDDRLIWVMSLLCTFFYFLMTHLNNRLSLNQLILEENKAEDNNINGIKKEKKRGPLRLLAINIYKSVFEIYGNFMLYFLPVCISKEWAIVSLMLMMVVICKQSVHIFIRNITTNNDLFVKLRV